MSDDKRFGPGNPGNPRLGGENDPSTKSVTSSRARNRTVMLTPEMTGHVRALLYNDEGQHDQSQELIPHPDSRPDPVNDILSPSSGWSRPERPDAQSNAGFSSPIIPDFGPAPVADAPPLGTGFNSAVNPGYENPQGSSQGSAGRPTAFGSPTIQGGLGQGNLGQGGFGFSGTAPFQGSAGARGLAGVQPPKVEAPQPPNALPPRKDRATQRFSTPEMETGFGEHQAGMEQAVQPQRRTGGGKVIGFLVSFDGDENGECFDVRSGRLLITCRPTDQGDYILINHETISPLHAIIRATKEGKVEVLDQLSEYGTGITRAGQEEEIEVAGARMVLQHGDVLRFGERRFIVCLVPVVKASAPKSSEASLGGQEGTVAE